MCRKEPWLDNKLVSSGQVTVQKKANSICFGALVPLSWCRTTASALGWVRESEKKKRKKTHLHPHTALRTFCVPGYNRSHKWNKILYLPVSSLCVWMIESPIPACGEPRKTSEAGRSRAGRVAHKSLAWTAGGNTEERGRRRMEGVR